MELAGIAQRPICSAEQQALPDAVTTAATSCVNSIEPNNSALALSLRNAFRRRCLDRPPAFRLKLG